MRLKTLNGAPLRAKLDFSPEVLIPLEWVTQFPFQSHIQTTDITEDVPLKWRRITPKGQKLKSDWSQPYVPTSGFQGSDPDVTFDLPGVGASLNTEQDTTNFDTTMTHEDDELEETEFMYHSLIFDNKLLSSQLVDAGTTDQSQSFLSTSMDSSSSFAMDSFQDSFQQSNTEGPILQITPSVKLTTLGALPDAVHLRRIYPQTPTPSLLCVLAASPEDRVVFTKKGGYKMRLREIIVADDTKSNFKISFWQRSSNGKESHSALEHTLQIIKTGDILLLRNVALNAFRDDVYGQSLNPSITRARTSIDVLMNSSGISNRQLAALPAHVAAAFTRVRKWANTHIASNRTAQKKRKEESQRHNLPQKRVLRSSSFHEETLPPDTMEST